MSSVRMVFMPIDGRVQACMTSVLLRDSSRLLLLHVLNTAVHRCNCLNTCTSNIDVNDVNEYV